MSFSTPLGSLVILYTFVSVLLCILYIARIRLSKEIEKLSEEVEYLIRDDMRNINRKSSFVSSLENRYDRASRSLENTNTIALIDQTYRNQRLKVIGISFQYEKVEELCRIAPNVMITLGLFGTFFGITLALFSLTNAVSQDLSSSIINPQLLSVPIQSMSIAFRTSLMGVALSLLLTAMNNIFDIPLSKNHLVSLLEDYLDNIRQIKGGQSRTNDIVKGVADRFDSFLVRFGQTVRGAVEASLKDKIEEIYNANLKASQIAETAFERLADASGTIQNGADSLQQASEMFLESSRIFENSQFVESLSLVQKQFSESSDKLSLSVFGLEKSITNLNSASTKLELTAAVALESNNSNIELLSIYQSTQEDLKEAMPDFRKALQNLQETLALIQSTENQSIKQTQDLNNIQNELAGLVSQLEGYSRSNATRMEKLSENMEGQFSSFSEIFVQNLSSQSQELNSRTQNLSDSLTSASIVLMQEISMQVAKNSKELSLATSLVQEYIRKIKNNENVL